MIALDNTATKQTHGNSSQHTQSTRSTYSSECTQDDSSDIRQEIDNCQEQLSKLHSMVKQLVDDLDDGKPIKKSKKKKNQKIRKYDDESTEAHHANARHSQQSLNHNSNHFDEWNHSDSNHSSKYGVRRNSICSRPARRNSIHSSRGIGNPRTRRSTRRHSMCSKSNIDDGASLISHRSLHSVSHSIKSLPREIELMDDDDSKSIGSHSAFSHRSRGSRSSRKRRDNHVSRETQANASTDNHIVENKQIVDPYGEKGVYSGALSKSTGMPNGRGLLEYEKAGHWYEGDWIHGRLTGYGRISNGSGDFYEGGLKNHRLHGKGVMRFSDGRVFEGKYSNGQMYQGKMTYQDGSMYDGSWLDGTRHGHGKCIFVDNSEYEGEFREGDFHGQGQMTWNDGGFYVGEWRDGEMHGSGKEVRPDGTLRHDGEWSRGKPVRS